MPRRKIEMKKIEDSTKCQVTYSKRRSNLMKKANELAVCCDVDLAFVAFSPSGRISKFSGEKRIEDVLLRYINISSEDRVKDVHNFQGKLKKLRNLTDHINGESGKLFFLDKHIILTNTTSSWCM
ncbi:agamous-like MADS-box protein AGL66 [Andrographis paniculata]|uniref:agamous-like MADS-box protein AGL66 n=1 Tax=Andrographis paniculata TaxID=175694 RepID=UPI0021E6F075|nr:agamous-like MADS-box protein AGL66 [Andrographis paniculata]